MSQGDSEKENRYVFKAPSEDNLADESDETGAIVGALTACIIISAVLLFLWKMLQRKKEEMKKLVIDIEEAPVRSDDEEAPNRSDDNEEIYCGDVETERKQMKKRTHEAKKATTWKQVQLPNSTMKIENDFDSFERNQADELILPPLSPIPSCSISLHEELTSSDTGYNSEICRRYSVLKRRRKSDPDELYMEHSGDILQSLKQSRKSLRTEQEKRDVSCRHAIEILRSCRDSIEAMKKRIAIHVTDESLISEERIKNIRHSRRLNETHRSARKRWCDTKQSEFDNKEAFVCMQDWFDGLHVHSYTREVAQEIFLLRSFHRSDTERNNHQRKTIQVAISDLRGCLHDITQIKTGIQRWKNEKNKSRLSFHFDSNKKAQPIEKLSNNIDSHGVAEQSSKIEVVLLPNLLFDGSCDEEQNKVSTGGEFNDRCSSCHHYLCQCTDKKMVADPQDENEQNTDDSAVGSIVNEQQHFKSKESVHEPNHSSSRHTVTLKLTEAPRPHVSSQRSSPNNQLTEKEVKKALQRVPYITMLRTIKRNGNNEWTITAVSSQKRVTNVRFNCRKKSFIIETTSSQ